MAKLVVLDGHTLNPGDLSWEPLQRFGQIEIYPRTPAEKVLERSEGAEILLVNKVVLSKELIDSLAELCLIVVTATGVNNVDLQAASEKGVPVTNASGYGATSVAQHVFALLLELTNGVARHNASVKRGEWSGQSDFSYSLMPLRELAGKKLGIYGFGSIGKRVARIGTAFGMQILAHTRHPDPDGWPEVDFCSLEALFERSDVISLHAALGAKNEKIIDHRLLSRMQKGSFLVNTARGGLVNENHLAEALQEGPLAGAGLDVLDQEPPKADHALLGLDNCFITPHNAWASRESRQRLMDIVIRNIEDYQNGTLQHVVNPDYRRS